jgi:metalloendopeptidase OMA1, mitochondrial
MKLFLVATMAMALCVQARAGAAPDEPRALAWTPLEVARASESVVARTVQRASESDALGCARYCRRIGRVWARLLRVFDAQRGEIASQFPMCLLVVRLPDVAAFATPGGVIVVSETFIRKYRLDDASLAFVLAHEASHVLLQHERLRLTAALAFMPPNPNRTVSDMYEEFGVDFGVMLKLEPVMKRSEYEADALGLKLAAQAGFDPVRQLALMERLARSGEGIEEVAVTHPASWDRLRRLRLALPAARRIYMQHRAGHPGGRSR